MEGKHTLLSTTCIIVWYGADEADSIPVTITFEQATGKNVLLLPMGSSTDAAHSINEKLDRRNYIEGTKLLGAYLHYVAEEPMVAA